MKSNIRSSELHPRPRQLPKTVSPAHPSFHMQLQQHKRSHVTNELAIPLVSECHVLSTLRRLGLLSRAL